jgi:predicted ATPase
MIVTRIQLKNWRNFQRAEVDIGRRVFVVGPNAAGKSNLLDAFRFLRDIAAQGRGGLLQAVEDRGGLSKIRCLSARRPSDVELEVHLAQSPDALVAWKYAIGLKQQPRGDRKPYLAYERVWKGDKLILDRPTETPEDKSDPLRMTQTHLENVNSNAEFREIADTLDSVLYLHLVPQLLRHPREFSGPGIPGDPFGRNFLERIAKVPEKTRQARLRKIEAALRHAVPQLKELTHITDTKEGGIPHLEAVCENWREHGARQREREFSDGTLRLIALLWALMEGEGLLLLEEPELSLNAAIIRKLPSIMHRILSKRDRQLIVSTHSHELLSDRGIGAEEVLLLTPSREGTQVRRADRVREVKPLLESGFSIAEAVLPHTEPKDVNQMELAL